MASLGTGSIGSAGGLHGGYACIKYYSDTSSGHLASVMSNPPLCVLPTVCKSDVSDAFPVIFELMLHLVPRTSLPLCCFFGGKKKLRFNSFVCLHAGIIQQVNAQVED